MGDSAPSGDAGAGVIGGVGWSCALAPQLENRTVAAIVELSKRDRRAPKRLPATKLYMVSRAPARVIEKTIAFESCIEGFRLRLNHTVQNDSNLVNSTEPSFFCRQKDKETCCKVVTRKPMQNAQIV